MQSVLVVVALVGAAWLVGTAVAGGLLRLDVDPLLVDTPGATWIPLPSAMLLGGVLGGLLVALLARFPLSVGARRRGARARADLHRRIADVADRTVLSELGARVAEHGALAAELATVAAP